MSRKKIKKASQAKVRDLVKQLHDLQVTQTRELTGIAKAIAEGSGSAPRANGRNSGDDLALVEQRVFDLTAQRAMLEAQIEQIQAEHARAEIQRTLDISAQTVALQTQIEDLQAGHTRTERQRTLDIKAQTGALKAQIEELEAENARSEALVDGLYSRIEAWRGKVGRLVEDVELRLRLSAENARRLQEQHSRLLDELGDAAAHAIADLAKQGSGFEQRLLESCGVKRSMFRKPLGVHDFVALGDKANANKDWKLAVDCYAFALHRDPSLVAIWVQFGHTLKESGLIGLAEVAYHRAAVLDAQSVDAHLQVGHFQTRIGQADAARAAFAKAAELDASAVPLAREAAQLSAMADGQVDKIQATLRGLVNEAAVVADEKPVRRFADVMPGVVKSDALVPAVSLNTSLAERYGLLLDEALGSPSGQDIIWLGIIDWHFRIQRPQHLAAGLAAQGRRVFYVSIAFDRADSDGRFRITNSPQLNVFELRLRLRGVIPPHIYSGFDADQIDDIRTALDEAISVLGIRAPAIVVQYPSWHPIAIGVPGALVVHDCLDLVCGFNNVPPAMVELDRLLTRDADVVITSSDPLAKHVGRGSIVVRNAAEVERFAMGAREQGHPEGGPPTIGYFGAIAEWFEIDWVLDCARRRPDWRFLLIGEITGFDRKAKSIPDNVLFTGELPYSELPSRLRDFDVALIPFKLTELIQCTNPVKMYEYMAAGKPVVATAMPEVVNGSDLAYIVREAGDLETQIARALAEDSPELRQKRMVWAANHTWEARSKAFADALDAATPKVSIVILAHNNWGFTRACLHSALNRSDYPNLEFIVVDNASTDGTRERLLKIRDPRLKVIRNEDNLGFAAGNNVGMRAATGDFVILLNNDTYVTKGWVRDLIRPMMLDPEIGLVGPITNNIGNEQKLSIHYANMSEMTVVARSRVRQQLRSRYEVSGLAFFCVAFSRATLERVGFLDEAYGLGFFEDDDYCRRMEKSGLRMVVADDVFIHHHLSASFDTLGTERKRRQMEINRALYEKHWGPWKPHVYRGVQGYGA